MFLGDLVARVWSYFSLFYAKVKNVCSFPPFPHTPSPCGSCKHVSKSNWPSQGKHVVLAAWNTLVNLYQLPVFYFLLAQVFWYIAGHLIDSLIEYGAVVEWNETKNSTNDQKTIGATTTLHTILLWTGGEYVFSAMKIRRITISEARRNILACHSGGKRNESLCYVTGFNSCNLN
jgi:hypothetical protein